MMDSNMLDGKDLPPYEKEQMFAEELESLIARFSTDNNVTYAQLIGCLEVAKHRLIIEGFEEDEEEEDE